MKKLILALVALSLCSCQRGCTAFERRFQTAERNYTIVMYSGGDTVYFDQFRGIVNDPQGSDGAYYFKGDTLKELSGDYVITSTK